ncbi:MAG: methyltransferase family protein [Candidatus Rokuibacteriota bacterium]
MKKRGGERAVDVLVGAGWALYAGVFLARVAGGGGLIDLGLLLFFTLLAGLFLIRHPARSSGARWETTLAVVGTFLPVVALRPASGGLGGLGHGIQVVSLAGTLIALICLGRSFGIAPADRGLRTTGIYGWVRHPLYATELAFYIGYLVANPSWRNFLGLIASTGIQICRLLREERILAGYASYAAQVRWRLLPYVW